MTQFSYTIQDELGLHARPAGLLAKEAAKFKSTVTVESGAKKGDAKTVSYTHLTLPTNSLV